MASKKWSTVQNSQCHLVWNKMKVQSCAYCVMTAVEIIVTKMRQIEVHPTVYSVANERWVTMNLTSHYYATTHLFDMHDLSIQTKIKLKMKLNEILQNFTFFIHSVPMKWTQHRYAKRYTAKLEPLRDKNNIFLQFCEFSSLTNCFNVCVMKRMIFT